MNPPDILLALKNVISAFDSLSISYYIGGSLASSVYGIARATMDVDIVADIQLGKISFFKQMLEDDYYIDAKMIEDAVKEKSSFNLIHLETMIKIDVFIYKHISFQEESMRRRRKDTIEDSADVLNIYISSPEDIILNKLLWYEMGEH